TVCLRGNLAHSARVEPTTTILNSSDISDIKEAICFISRSTELSLPVFKRVVIASVAIDRFGSVIRFSRSTLHDITSFGWFIAILLRARTAANRLVRLVLQSISCRTEMAELSSFFPVQRRLMIALAAS